MGRTKGSEAGNLSVTKRGSKGKDRSTVIAKSGFDGPMNAPWRKTVSIFKQPVTLVHTTSRETKNPTPEQLKRGAIGPKAKADKPRQMFWAKALEGACAMVPMCSADRVMTDPNEHIAQRLNLAGKMEPALAVLGPDASAASLCSALHGFCSGAVTGQTATKKQLDSNPSVNTNIDQPFVQVYLIDGGESCFIDTCLKAAWISVVFCACSAVQSKTTFCLCSGSHGERAGHTAAGAQGVGYAQKAAGG
uniref:Ribosomal_L7Ae domain-containing protein n=1 Tax=Ascaris lumbricoides TaxID=6252 RepID=A0A0M3I3Q7_ASCLU